MVNFERTGEDMSRTHITDITHLLDKNGNISEFMTDKGWKLAFFLAFISNLLWNINFQRGKEILP